MTTSQFRRKPTIVEATLWMKNGDHPLDGCAASHDGEDIECEGNLVRYFRPPHVRGQEGHADGCGRTWHDHGWIDTGSYGHTVCPGDWIVRDVAGEHYPVRPDVFAATYEPVVADGGDRG